MSRSYQNIISHVFAWSSMTKLNLWCMIVPPLGSHGRPWGFAPWPPMTACRRHNHTPQVQFTHMRPHKDMQNMLFLSRKFLHLHQRYSWHRPFEHSPFFIPSKSKSPSTQSSSLAHSSSPSQRPRVCYVSTNAVVKNSPSISIIGWTKSILSW